MLKSNTLTGSSVIEVMVALSIFSIVLFGFAKGMAKASYQVNLLHQSIAKYTDEKN